MQNVFTLKTALKISLSALFASTLLTACGSDLPSLGSAANHSGSAFSLANRAGTEADSQQGFGRKDASKGAPGMKGGHRESPGRGLGIAFGADLNLSTEQQAALKALHDELKPTGMTPPERPDMSALKTAIETAFVSETFDLAALEALQPAPPDDSVLLTQDATLLVKSWAILTDEQKASVKARQAEMATAERPDRPESANHKKPVNPLIEKLSLSTEQAAALEALKPERPDPAKMHAQHAATQVAIQTELDQANPSVDKLVAILTANRPTEKAGPLSHLASLHAILIAEQRQSFVALGLAAGGPGMGGLRPDGERFGPPGGDHFGGAGGPGMGRPEGPHSHGGPGGMPDRL